MTDTFKIRGLAGLFLIVLALVYSNHFDNGFYFDDNHAIVDNQYITILRTVLGGDLAVLSEKAIRR